MKKTVSWKKIFFFILVFFVLFELFVFYKVIFFDEKKSPWIIFLTDRNGEVITDKANEFWYKKISEIELESKFVKSLLLIEDKNFYSHFWVNVLAKFRALFSNISSFDIVSWWSTITEQFLKNKYFVWEKRTYLQKIKEANLALFFSFFYSKDEILKLYLENIYFWNNLYGLISAIETYFWKTKLSDLTDEEITILLSLIRYPSAKSLQDKKFSDIFDRIKNRLWFSFEKQIKFLKKRQNIDKYPFVTKYFCEGKKVNCIWKTSIDLELQDFSKNILNKTLKNLSDKNVTNWIVLAIKPETMEVLVYLWSRDFYNKNIDSEVDIIKTALRQPWSTMKPFLYLLALEKWAFANSFLLDLKSEYDSFLDWKSYFSENYSLKDYWLVRFQKALWNSFNNSTVRLAKDIWLSEVFNYYKKYWFKFLEDNYEFFGYSLVLWNASITLENLALSYVNLIPGFEINNNRKLNFSYSEKKEKTGNIDKNKFLLYKILQNPDNRDVSFWVNSILNTSIFQAVKTGTSSNFKDNLVISYSKDLVLLVWVWNNDNSSMKWVTGITWAWYVWHQVMEKSILKWFVKKYDYKTPAWVEKKPYCLDKNCFRQEIWFDKSDAKYFSRILEKDFSKKDLFIKLEDLEEKRLNDLWFYFSD